MNTLKCFFPGLVFLLMARAECATSGPTTPNPGLRYYYELPPSGPGQTIKVDVCVYGGTPGGVSSAVQAGRMGKKVALAVFRRHVGGMTSGGLTAVDLGIPASIGGMTRAYYHAISPVFKNTLSRSVELGFRPSQAEEAYLAMLEKAGVTVYYEHRLEGVVKQGTNIRVLTFENGDRIEAKMFIDATYEGDLLGRAGVSNFVGREDNSKYGETVNGFQISFTHQFCFPVDPYRTPGDAASGLLPGISPEAPRKRGTGDHYVQAYNFRMWAVKASDGLPFPKPEGYNRDDYALLLRYLTTKPGFKWDLNYGTGPLKLNLGDCNNAGPFSTDLVGGSYDWPNADYATRERIFQAHVRYQQGLMWLLANDPEVPENLRERVRHFGLPKDEFTETGGWPHELYVREGRRMISDYVMTEQNCAGKVVAPDSVGLGSYNMDSHHTSRVVVKGTVKAEGDFELLAGRMRPYPISYRSIIPTQRECDNLLVPVCLSATHVAYGSIRMEPVFMILGESAGAAAALAIDAGVPVQKLPYARLRQHLLAEGQILDWPITALRSTPARTGSPAFQSTGNGAGRDR